MEWDEAKLKRFITDEIEESARLDYKAAAALAKDKRNEITKDVSAMANTEGGVIIYGLKENQTKKHIVEKIDPIDRRNFSKEWLDQIINNIRPHIDGLIIHPVSIKRGLRRRLCGRGAEG